MKNGVVEFGLIKRDAIVQAASAQIGGIIAKDSVYAKFAYTASDGMTYLVKQLTTPKPVKRRKIGFHP